MTWGADVPRELLPEVGCVSGPQLIHLSVSLHSPAYVTESLPCQMLVRVLGLEAQEPWPWFLESTSSTPVQCLEDIISSFDGVCVFSIM